MADAFDELRKASAERRKQLEARADELADEYDQWRAQPEVESETVADRNFTKGFRLLREQLDTSMQLLRAGALDRRLDEVAAETGPPPLTEELKDEPLMEEPIMEAPATDRSVAVESLTRIEPPLETPPPVSPPQPEAPPSAPRRGRRRPRIWLIAANIAVVALIVAIGSVLYRSDSTPKHQPITLEPPVSLVAPRITWSLRTSRIVYKGPPCSLTWHYRITLKNGAGLEGKPAVIELSGPDYKRSLRRQIPVSRKGTVEFDSAAPKCTNRDRNTVKLVSVANSSNLRRQSDS